MSGVNAYRGGMTGGASRGAKTGKTGKTGTIAPNRGKNQFRT